MEIRLVVDRSRDPRSDPERQDAAGPVRIEVADANDGAASLAGLLRCLAGAIERPDGSGAEGADGGDEARLRVAMKPPSGPPGGAESCVAGGWLPAPLSLRPPPPRQGPSPNRADLEFVSHELRTPINAVMGYTSLLREQVYGELSADQAEAVERIRNAARNLLGALDHLRDVAKLDLGRFEGDPDAGDGGEDDGHRTTGDLPV